MILSPQVLSVVSAKDSYSIKLKWNIVNGGTIAKIQVEPAVSNETVAVNSASMTTLTATVTAHYATRYMIKVVVANCNGNITRKFELFKGKYITCVLNKESA